MASPHEGAAGDSLALQHQQLLRLATSAPPEALAPLWHSLASQYAARARYGEAEAAFAEALACNPRLPEAWAYLGGVYSLTRRPEQAEAAFERALELQPKQVFAWSQLGCLYRGQGRIAESEQAFLHALELAPEDPEIWNNYANLLQDSGLFGEAETAYLRAIQLRPQHAGTWSNFLLALNSRDGLDADKVAAVHRHAGEQIEAPFKPHRHAVHTSRDPLGRLRVGFVSGDFRAHPIAYFLESVLGAIDRTRFSLIAYANQSQEDAVTARLRPLFDDWHWVRGEDDETLATRIQAEGIHILFDLAGHTAGNRLPVFARKPAPVQITWLGYFATTGLTAMDYILCNRIVIPESEVGRYTEQALYLPETHWCYTLPQEDIAPSPLPALTHGHITFGCFNNAAKLTPTVIETWARVLQSVPGSRLLLKSRLFSDEGAARQFRDRFAAHGIPVERLILQGQSDYTDYLEAYRGIDIALDPFPYNGGTTSAEALWMGVPVLTLHGDRYVARMGENILRAVGLDDWVAKSREDYIALAAAWAENLQGLSELRQSLRTRISNSSLCDARRFARHLEAALQRVWEACVPRQG